MSRAPRTDVSVTHSTTPATPPRPLHPGSRLLVGLLIAAMIVLVYAAIGGLTLRTVPDSPSYLNYPFGSLAEALRSQRPPGYPLFLRLVDGTLGLRYLPLVQLLLHLAACLALTRELGRWGTPISRSLAAGLAIALGCTAMANMPILATDAPAASLGVLTATALLRWARLDGRLTAAGWVALAALLAIAMRPAYLFLLPWTFLAGMLLLHLRHPPARSTWRDFYVPGVGPACVVMALIALPLCAWVGLRGRVVGDLALLPFGHQNLAGLTVQWVTDDELLATPEATRPLAAEIIRQRQRFLDTGGRFASGDPGATMTLESRWDDYTWYVVVPAADRLHPGDPIASHQAIRNLNRDLLKRYPGRYARWLLLGARRAAWGIAADLVMHPPFLILIGLALLWELGRIVRGRCLSALRPDAGLDALYVIAISYAALKVALVISTSPPIGRFADAAAIFLPAWLAGRAVERMSRPLPPEPAAEH